MRTESMSRARQYLVRKYGESFGQTMWVECLQTYWVTPEDEVPEKMRIAVYGC